ncbi:MULTISPECIES: glycerol-3-phosphate 1-O-acyltransferase PlsY [unclassified Bacillus (in: firmicutes)]|uniref:glycerol-3-phosphate 1-O-acyltransferase PlsY n=1 Tax=unclassified Bacillus (in: firmicutes) TaxID=185979 RepID=UPI0008EF42A9|nr:MULTISPECIES: glycerol-3-phosphate 1-O-acyltransferase PlsY [unclassified Bacillus (in: firmicutes)]SFB23322.1 acyl-phosphate glycerol-3-phosphate acyltransferase [Bacillus sp. UNCCL13]SFQ87717.1 acyl-phosphate glycerol-3-phosphate acyltransferase [Bacillus sp. cl95]
MIWILLLAAYLIGSIPTALIVGKLVFDIDIRDHGSHNPGATNTLRVLGKKAAIFVLIVDVDKGVLAALLPQFFAIEADPLYFGLIAVVGHCFPIFAGFRGGKAIATTAGALLVANIWMLLVAYLSFFLVIYLTKYVFFGSISVGLVLLAYSLFMNNQHYEWIFSIFSIFLIVLHRSNIRNFFLDIEPKINDKNLKKDRIPPKGNTIGK